jgi:ribokinase
MKIAVIGSINTDILYHVDREPNKGETLFGSSYIIKNGGKGANQAIALSALESNVLFFGAVGNDPFAEKAIKNLKEKSIETYILKKQTPSGLAIIRLSNNDNNIIVFKGANDEITNHDIDQFLNDNTDIDIIVAQAEINLDAIIHLIEEAKNRNIKIIFNPAPAVSLPHDIIDKVDYLIPNEVEAETIFGTSDYNAIVTKYPKRVIITMGSRGVLYHDGNVPILIPSLPINVVDTTGAGDSFIAGFASAIVRGKPLEEAVKKGIKVASITCTVLGAQTSHNLIREEFDNEKNRNTK